MSDIIEGIINIIKSGFIVLFAGIGKLISSVFPKNKTGHHDSHHHY